MKQSMTLPPPDHRVEFYESAPGLARVAAGFLVEGWKRGDALLVIATREHLRFITQALRGLEVDLDGAWSSGRLRFLEARQTLARFMRDGLPDPELFAHTIGGAMVEARRVSGRVRAYGEMVDVLWADGNRAGALLLEDMWNGLAESQHFSLLCGYADSHFLEPGGAGLRREICSRHTHVMQAAS
jgi:hypothetical protein